MILYHGSDALFDRPALSKCREGKDFGKGIYLTRDYEQAVKWATARQNNHGYVYTYEIRDTLLADTLNYKIKSLTRYDKEWLDFVVNCRYKKEENEFDLVYDRMADSTAAEISDALEAYYLGKLSVFETLAIVRSRKAEYCQYCFKTEKIIASELHERCKPKEVFKNE